MYPIGSAGSGAPEEPIKTWLGKAWQKTVFGAWVIDRGNLRSPNEVFRTPYSVPKVAKAGRLCNDNGPVPPKYLLLWCQRVRRCEVQIRYSGAHAFPSPQIAHRRAPPHHVGSKSRGLSASRRLATVFSGDSCPVLVS